MSSAFDTWGSRIALGATLLGGGLGIGMSCEQDESGDNTTISAESRTDDPPESVADPAASQDVVAVQMPELDKERSKGIFAIPASGNPYEISRYGRQVLAPATEFFTTPTSLFLQSRGRYRMGYEHRVRERDNVMYGKPGERAAFSRKTYIGRFMRWLYLPKSMRNRPLTPEDHEWLRANGAYSQSISNRILILPYAVRLGVNIYGFTRTQDDGRNGLGHVETAVMITDTASITSHIVDLSLWSRGLGQVAGASNPSLVERALQPGRIAPMRRWMTLGGYEGAAKSLTLSHRISLGSNVLMMVTGAVRLYSEYVRMERTGAENLSTLLVGGFEFFGGLSSCVLILFLLQRARQLKESAEEEAVDYRKVCDRLVGFTPFPGLIQACVRAPGMVMASAMISMNGVALASALDHMAAGVPASHAVLVPVLGLASSGLALVSSYMNTPGKLAVSQFVFLGSFVLCGLQSLLELG